MNVISLFDESGNALRPWAEAGCFCFALDILNANKTTERFPSGGCIVYVEADLSDEMWFDYCVELTPDFVLGFPPCTDLAVSGAAHFKAKAERNPSFHEDAMKFVRLVERVGTASNCPWMLENPVSVISSLWRKPDHKFSPNEFGGYLPADDIHPRWPDYIPARDAYSKTTCLWVGGGYIFPTKKPVPHFNNFTLHENLGGKTAKTKQIRSETPRGFALANFQANYKP